MQKPEYPTDLNRAMNAAVAEYVATPTEENWDKIGVIEAQQTVNRAEWENYWTDFHLHAPK